MTSKLHIALLAASISLVNQAFAATDDAVSDNSKRGYEIASDVDARDSGFGDYRVQGKMTITRPGGATAERGFEMNTLEYIGSGDRRLVVFQTPRDLAGFVSLTFNNPGAPDDQWIYLPAVKRVKRLASRDKTGSFGGSEFSYEDIATWELSNYTYEYIREEPCGEKPHACHVLANIPKYQYSGYSKLVETVDPEIGQPRQIIYFDKAGNEFKRLEFFDYKQYEGKFWRPDRIVMTNSRDQSVSEITWSDYKFKTGLKASDMTDSRMAYWSR